MKAIEKLIQLRKEDPSIVAIAKDENGKIHFFREELPYIHFGFREWWTDKLNCTQIFDKIEFDSDNWKECIVKYKNLENYEVKMMSISVQEYERLIEAEKKLKEIQKFFV